MLARRSAKIKKRPSPRPQTASLSCEYLKSLCAGKGQLEQVSDYGDRVTSGPTAKIEYRETPFALDVLQHRCDILADVVTASAFPEIFRMLVVIIQRQASDFFQVLRTQFQI
jgi:hypothetical protein